jgi:DNA-cytosine methyltransferase
MNVLSLFDGMSCGRLALDRLGIEVDQYYAAEIDKYAIQVTQENWPETIQLGDVTQIKAKDLPKIDLILAGSPCQGFSFAGKQLAFDDPRSALFFEFVRILKECNPKYFLLENVKMKKEFLDIITQQVGVEPILINSALVSAQNRQRYYWTNIPGVEQPENRGIVLRDILETESVSDEFRYSQKSIDYMNRGNEKWQQAGNRRADGYEQTADKDKSFAITANWHKGVPYNYFKDDTSNLPEKSSVIKSNYYKSSKANFENDKSKGGKFSATGIPQTTHDTPKQIGTAEDINGHDILKRVYSPDGKAPTLTTNGGGNREPKVVAGAWRGRSLDKDGKNVDWKSTTPKQMLELRKDEKSNALSQVTKDNVVVQSYREVRTEEAKRLRRESKQKTGKDHTPFRAKELVPREDGKVGPVTPGLNNDHLISLQKLPLPEEDTGERIVVDEEKKQLIIKEATNKGFTVIEDGDCFDITHFDSKTRRGRSMKYKCNALTAGTYNYMRYEHPKDESSDVYWRKLTPIECERLQTVPDNYTASVSNTQRYKMLGNGWTIEVIAHILKNMKTIEEGGEVPKSKGQQGFDF